METVRRQTYPNVEHIIVDGGSTDNTVSLLRSSQGITWVSEPDSGQAAAINKGFALCRGEVVSWLNADDQLKPWATERAVLALLRERSGWVYGNVEVVEGNNRRLWIPSTRPARDLFRLGKGGVIPQPGTFIKAEEWRRVGGLDENLELAMDFDLWLRLIDAEARPTYIPETLAVFNIHADSKTGRVGLEQFFLEEAQALTKSGRARLAQLAMGRAAAHRALEQNRISRRRLSEELERVSEQQHDRKGTQRVRAAAHTEAALVELNHSLRGLRHVATAGPWLVRETRARLLSAALRSRPLTGRIGVGVNDLH